MQIENLSDSFQSHFDKHHDPASFACKDEPRHFCYAISVNSLPGQTVEQVAIAAKRPNPSIRVSTAGAIKQEAKFEIDPTPNRADGHSDVFLPPAGRDMPDVFQLMELQQAFGPIIDNPAKK